MVETKAVQTRDVTLDAWRSRMQRVTDWLVDHLDQPFDLNRLAELAYFSPYHFHRVYTVAMGEPVAEDFSLAEQDAPIHITHTSAGRCAQMVFTGPYAELHTAYDWLYEVWLPQSGEQPGDQPPIEEYLNDPRSNPPSAWQTAISIPLQQ